MNSDPVNTILSLVVMESMVDELDQDPLDVG
jgi:hypothetical protein